jgi:ribosomal protein L37AE/L43A
MRKINFLQASLIFLLVLSIGFGSGYLILYYLAPHTQASQLVTRIMILFVMGISIGLVCRLTIPSRMWFLKLCFGILGALLSILGLDWFFPSAFALLHEQNFNIAWWSIGEYTQIGCLLLTVSFIALIGRRKTVTNRREIPQPELKRSTSKQGTIPSKKRSPIAKKNGSATVILKSVAKKSPKKRSTAKKAANKPVIKNAAPAIKVKTAARTAPKRKKITAAKLRNGNNNVKLTGSEDHHCPYCLEEVRKNDPRGVWICPDCGTWHHRDCWEITGSCQIAHKHEL